MRSATASKTAAQVALSRAIETRRPTGQRVCDDPFAERFVGRRYRMLLGARPVRAAVVRLIETMFPGHHHYVVVRTRYIDDFLARQLVPEVRQLVILGAGFDSRAYRFRDRLRDVVVFEVDHPATSRMKVAAVRKLLRDASSHVTYVPVDFDRESLATRLAAAGYRPDQRTIFLWEGTTPYLSAAAVDDTLAFIAGHSGPGSMLLFDYILRHVLDGTCDLRGAYNEHQRMKRTSEPFVFGIPERDVGGFLAARGYRDVHDVGGAELHDLYLLGRQAYVKPWWRIAHATVARSAVLSDTETARK